MTKTNPPLETETQPVLIITTTTTTTITITTIEDPTTIIIITEDHPQSKQEVNIIREIIIIKIITEEVLTKEPQETNSHIKNLFLMLLLLWHPKKHLPLLCMSPKLLCSTLFRSSKII
jgi:hypothetical protein